MPNWSGSFAAIVVVVGFTALKALRQEVGEFHESATEGFDVIEQSRNNANLIALNEVSVPKGCGEFLKSKFGMTFLKQRELLGVGSYGAAYKVGGIVVKVGSGEDAEHEALIGMKLKDVASVTHSFVKYEGWYKCNGNDRESNQILETVQQDLDNWRGAAKPDFAGAPFHLLQMELIDWQWKDDKGNDKQSMTLFQYAWSPTFPTPTLTNINSMKRHLFQVFHALLAAWKQLHFTHLDLTANNVFFRKAPSWTKNTICYLWEKGAKGCRCFPKDKLSDFHLVVADYGTSSIGCGPGENCIQSAEPEYRSTDLMNIHSFVEIWFNDAEDVQEKLGELMDQYDASAPPIMRPGQPTYTANQVSKYLNALSAIMNHAFFADIESDNAMCLPDKNKPDLTKCEKYASQCQVVRA